MLIAPSSPRLRGRGEREIPGWMMAEDSQPPGGAATTSSTTHDALRRELERLRSHQNRGLLAAMIDESPHGIFVSDAEGNLIFQNRAAERIWAGRAAGHSTSWGQYRAF